MHASHVWCWWLVFVLLLGSNLAYVKFAVSNACWQDDMNSVYMIQWLCTRILMIFSGNHFYIISHVEISKISMQTSFRSYLLPDSSTAVGEVRRYGLLAQTMAAPEFVPITDPLLQNFKTRMREHLRVPAVLTVTQCIACQAPRTVTEAGRFEHERSGICEACWDTLVGQDDAAKLRQCTRLLDINAADLLMTWIMISKTKVGGRAHLAPAHARILVAVVTGQVQLPEMWVAGLEPPPLAPA